MSKFNGRAVSMLRLHEVIHIIGAGQVGPAIDVNVFATKGLGSATLTKEDGGVLLAAKGIEVFIPDTMCKSIQLVPETVKEQVTLKTK